MLGEVDELHRASDIASGENMMTEAKAMLDQAKGLLRAVRILEESEADPDKATEVECLVKGGPR